MLEQIVPGFTMEKCPDITTAIDLYNAHLYIKDGQQFPEWEDAFIDQCKSVDKKIMALLGRYCASISDDNFYEIFSKVEFSDFGDFWKLIASFNVAKRLQWNSIESCIKSKLATVQSMLYVHEYSKIYNEEIADFLLANPDIATPLLINKYMSEHLSPGKEIFLPESLDADKKEIIISSYLDGSEQNSNYLEMISQWRSTSEFCISDKIRLKAKRLNDKFKAEFFAKPTSNAFSFGASVSFCDLGNNLMTIGIQGFEIQYRYSRDYIREHLDYFSVLKNFVILFGFVDSQLRASMVSKPTQMGVLERTLGGRSTTDYLKGIAFIQREIATQAQLTAYEAELKKNNVAIEDAFKWFFDERLPQKYGLKNISITLPTEGTYLTKCRNLFPEMEKVLKEYKLYVEDGSVDLELLQFGSSPLIYGMVPSLFDHKYIYGTGKDFERAAALAASDQCMLAYLPRIGEKYKSFYELLCNEEVKVDEYAEFAKGDLRWLIEKGLLSEEEGILKPVGYIMHIMYELYHEEVMDYNHLTSEIRMDIDALVSRGWLQFGSTLFSIPEQNFISFNLDRNKYGNGYDIRNKYVHGSISSEVSEDEHRKNYYRGITILALIVLKIDDELHLKQKQKEKLGERYCDSSIEDRIVFEI